MKQPAAGDRRIYKTDFFPFAFVCIAFVCPHLSPRTRLPLPFPSRAGTKPGTSSPCGGKTGQGIVPIRARIKMGMWAISASNGDRRGTGGQPQSIERPEKSPQNLLVLVHSAKVFLLVIKLLKDWTLCSHNRVNCGRKLATILQRRRINIGLAQGRAPEKFVSAAVRKAMA